MRSLTHLAHSLTSLTHPPNFLNCIRTSTTMKTSKTATKRSLHAMDTVINTAELFEAILEQLPFLDLVLASGVNHRFRDFINRSKKLKRKLFILPAASAKHKPNKCGVIGSSTTQEDLLENPIQEPINLPSLLVNSAIPQTAHLSERAVKTTFLPYDKYLTQPPCAHITVHFTYVCITPDQTHVQLEATRSSYRKKGVTLLSIRQMLFQSGAVKMRSGDRKQFKINQGSFRYNKTIYDEIELAERFYGCKMKIHLAQTTIGLYANVLPEADKTI
jgi:hypothetical protein